MTARSRLVEAFDAAAPTILAAAILAAAAASSIQYDILRAGRPARWVLLGVLFVFAAARTALGLSGWRFPRATALLLGTYCGLALVSFFWSVHRSGTLGRATGQVLVVGCLVLLAGCAVGRPELGRKLLDGILLAAAIVAVAGFVYWLIHPSRATIAATTEYPTRYQGIEQNPNTAALLFAIAIPVAFWRALDEKNRIRRGIFVLLVVAFAASLTASGSRGGIAASFFALLVVVALAPLTWPRRLALAGAMAATLVVSAWVVTIPKALPAHAAVAATKPTRNAELTLPLEQEIGNPWWTHKNGSVRRSLFNTSVRARALRGAVDQASERPILGYGFGAEQWAFVNRYYGFSSQNPEDGYVGSLLQLGAVGLAMWLAVLAACVIPGVRTCLAGARKHLYALGAVGAAAGALAMGLSQSFFHGPGGIGYVALWTALLLASSTTMSVASAR